MPDWIPVSQGICIDGVNSSVRPSLIGERQVAWMVNGAVRGGVPRTRPAFRERLSLPGGLVQGAGYFSVNRGKIILSIGGRIHRVNVAGNSFSHDEIVLPWRNSATLPTAWMQETVGSFVIQDGQSAAIIYDGASVRRSDIFGGEVPIGRQMAFGNGRLWVAVSPFDVKAGDIVTDSGSELRFTESGYLLGGGSFSFPRPITALAFLPVNNTATGYGSLMVMAKSRVDSVRAEVSSRDLWQAIPGFVTQVLDDVGAASHASVTPVNQDLYWRDANGEIRSLRAAAQDAATPGNSGLSREVARITDHETAEWLEQCSGIYFDNRLFFTASPFRAAGGAVAFGKLISLDFAPMSSMRGKAAPAYDGEWTGANFLRLVTGRFDGRQRAFAVVQNADTSNSLWELMPQDREDVYLDGADAVTVPIRSAVDFREFDFGTPQQLKRLARCDVYPAMIEGEVDVTVYWRVANRSQWNEWGTFSAKAKMTDAAEATAETEHAFKNLRAQERGRVKSLTIPDATDSVTGRVQHVGHAFQVRVVWTGSMALDRIVVWAKPLADAAHSDVQDLPGDFVQATVSGNEVSYTIKPT